MEHNENSTKIVTRFAPSPTGMMHIGGVRTALFAYLWAVKNNGDLILRIEDTDKEREVAGSIEHIQETLKWLGLSWKYGPDKDGPFGSCIQSKRLDTYHKAALELIEKGHAYPDPYTKEELEAFKAEAEANKKQFLYRDHRPATTDIWDRTRPLRFKVPEVKRYSWTDAVRGELTAGEESLDDFIIIKSDGYPTYSFAHIIDDYHMGVTHIFRADEFISSTPRFLSLYEALGIVHPVFATLPPILREDRTKKLGKRDGAKDFLEYRALGYDPMVMMNFLALVGWNPGTEQEIFDDQQSLADAFTLEGIQSGGAIINDEKLRWISREHLLKIPMNEYLKKAGEYLTELFQQSFTNEQMTPLATLVRDRISVWSDIPTLIESGELDFVRTTPPQLETAKINWKDTDSKMTREHLESVLTLLSELPDESFTNPENVKNAIWEYAEKVGRGCVLWPLRYALTGKEKSPDPFTVASIIGRSQTLLRIQAAHDLL